MNLALRCAIVFFRHLYTTFAPQYDLVAACVSFGEWRNWGATALEFCQGRVLEVGHGPGHLLFLLSKPDDNAFSGNVGRGIVKSAVGIDLSAQMTHQAAHKFKVAGRSVVNAQADTGRLPFGDGAFDCVLSTFPAPYIFEADSLKAIHRVLRTEGMLVVLPHAHLRGSGLWASMLRALYAITGQRLGDEGPIRQRFAAAGFGLHVKQRETPRATVTLWLLRKIG